MYRDDLAREAKLIALGHQEFVREFEAIWARLKARLGF
jgi:hypothetical protein